MNLDEEQRKKVAEWIREGAKLSDIQSRITSELDVNLTYMEVRLLVDDLKLVPKDVEPPKASMVANLDQASAKAGAPASPHAAQPAGQPRAGTVSVSVAEIARPGAVASGVVTFSDGNKAEWYLDQTGRLGLLPATQGYRPTAEDVQLFQEALQNELASGGY
jgi:hypothetical protein